jgi:hypothetical protein
MKLTSLALLLALTQVLFAQNTKSILKKQPKQVQQIIHSETKAFRGFSFGDSKELIKSQEVLKIHSETDSVLSYTLQLDADDTADLIYYFDANGKAKSFAIIFILGDEKEEQILRDHLTKYYTEKYGMYTVINQEDELWDSKLGHMIEMRDTSDEAGMEIEVVYYVP